MRSIDWLTTISNRIRATRFQRARLQRARRKHTGNRFTRAAGLVQSEGPRAQTEDDIREGLWRSFDVAPRLTRDSRRFQRQVWNTSDIAAMTERLEDRTLLSAVSEAAPALNLDINSAETIGISTDGTTYTLTTSGTWTGSDTANVTGTGTSTLTVTAAGLAAFDTINMTDSAAGAVVNFDNSTGSYSDTINVTLDDAGAGTITFSGSSPFIGSAALAAVTARNVVLSSGSSITTVNGGITLVANTGAIAGDFQGISVEGMIQSTGAGDITLTGTGGESATSGLFGVAVAIGSSITATGAANVSIIGTGGAGTGNHGGTRVAGATLSVNTGDLTLTGTAGGPTARGVQIQTNPQLISTGSGNISITGTPTGSGIGINLAGPVGGGSAAGNVSLFTDLLNIAGAVQSTGALTIEPLTASTTIGLGGGAGTLNLDDTELGFLQNGFSSITIGKSGAGNIDINTASFSDPVTLLTNGKILDNTGTDLNMTSGDTATGNGTVDPGQSLGILTVTGNFSFADNSTFEVEIGGTTPGTANTNHDQIDATGSVTIGTGVTLNPVQFNSFTPALGNTFEIINRTGGSGEFDGLSEGARISNFLGSGLDATITYSGDDGNDVVLTVVAAAPATTTDVTLVGNVLTITDAESDDTADDLVISFATDTYTITDSSGSLIDASSIAGSTGSGTATVTVPVGSIDGINFNTLGGDDVVNVTSVQPSLAGGFTISGGTGRDRATINGDIATTGTGAVNITVSANVLVNSTATISTVNGGITLSGNAAGTTTGILTGVDINGATLSTSGSGAISLTGTAGTSGDGIGVRSSERRKS